MAVIQNSDINTNFNQILDFNNITTTSDDNGVLQKTFTSFRKIKGRVEQVAPAEYFDGVQDQVRAYTTQITTRYFSGIDNSDVIIVKNRLRPSNKIVTTTYLINDITTVGTDGFYVVISASVLVPAAEAAGA